MGRGVVCSPSCAETAWKSRVQSQQEARMRMRRVAFPMRYKAGDFVAALGVSRWQLDKRALRGRANQLQVWDRSRLPQMESAVVAARATSGPVMKAPTTRVVAEAMQPLVRMEMRSTRLQEESVVLVERQQATVRFQP